MSSTILGLKKLEDKLNRIASVKTYEKALGQSAAIVERDAKIKTPVDTGLLRQSIAIQTNNQKLEATVGTNLDYARYVEYGTGIFSSTGAGRNTPWTYKRPDGSWVTTQGQAAQPFMGPALRENREEIVAKFKEVLSKEVSK